MCKGAKNTQWRKDRLFNKCCRENWISKCQKMGFPGGSACKESTCNVRDLDSFPRLGRFPGEGNGYPVQYSGLEKSMDRGT